MDYSIVEMHQNPDNFTDKPFFKSSSTRAGSPPLSKNENIGLFVVLCPPDGSFWQKLTYMLGFISLLIFDGVYSSFFLFDSRVGMTTEYLPPAVTRILENLAVVYLFCYLTERFSCAYINRYGFRYCLFIGSILSITWFILLLCFIENVFVHEYLFLAIVGGGIGMGMIKTSFFGLLFTLFVAYRHTEHLCLQMGSFTGKMLISAVAEYQLLYSDLKMVPHIYLDPVGQKTSTEAVITFIAGYCSLFADRWFGYLLHQKSLKALPLYFVGVLVLMTNGLSLIMFAVNINDLAKMFSYFGLLGFFFSKI